MKFYSLSSSSQGNCYYLASDNSALLIDAGISAKKTENALAAIGPDSPELKGILLTHEHIDHMRSVGALAKRLDLPVFATDGTWQALRETKCTVPETLRCTINDCTELQLDDLTIRWQKTNHDCLQPVFFSIATATEKMGLITDTGELDPSMTALLYDSDILIAEANHDIQMLKNGPYPLSVKKRILSPHGHLSNEACAQGLLTMIGPHTKHVMLAHLSQHNNTPALAYQTVRRILNDHCAYQNYNLWVARAESRSSLLET